MSKDIISFWDEAYKICSAEIAIIKKNKITKIDGRVGQIGFNDFKPDLNDINSSLQATNNLTPNQYSSGRIFNKKSNLLSNESQKVNQEDVPTFFQNNEENSKIVFNKKEEPIVNKLLSNIEENTPINTNLNTQPNLKSTGILSTTTNVRKPNIFSDKLKKSLGGLLIASSLLGGISHLNIADSLFTSTITKPINNVTNKQVSSITVTPKQVLETKMKLLPKEVQEQAMRSTNLLNTEDSTKPYGAFINLSAKGTSLNQNTSNMKGFKGWNTFIGHGNWRLGVRRGLNDTEAKALGVGASEFLSAKGVADMIRSSPNYNPDFPVKLLNCELGQGILPQEIADQLGNSVMVSDENIWFNDRVSSGVLGSFKAKKDLVGKETIDFKSPGNVFMVHPRDNSDRGSLINLYSKTQNSLVSPERNGTKASGIENIIMGEPSTLNNMGTADLISTIENDPYFNKNLPITFITQKGLNREMLANIANKFQQPVRYYDGKETLYDEFGFVGSYNKIIKGPNGFKGDSKHRVGTTTILPTTYKPLTQRPVQINNPNAPWMDYMTSILGTRESGMSKITTGEGNNAGREIQDILKTVNLGNGAEWCGAAINWAVTKAGLPKQKGGAMSLAWRNYGVKLDQPAFGSIATFSHGGGKGHAGFVVGLDKRKPGNILLLGGNQSDAINYGSYPIQNLKFNHPKGFTPDFKLKEYDTELLGINPTAKHYPYLPKEYNK